MCSVHLCKSVRKRTHLRVVGRFFSHRAHRVNRAFLRTFRAHRTPPAYRVHRGLSAIIITKKGYNEAYILFIGGISVITPLPFGGGEGGGASWGRGRGHYLSEPCEFCSSVLSVRKRTLENYNGEVFLSQSTQS